METPRPFAHHGGEKMLYDVRQGPVALLHDNIIYVAYHANPEDAPPDPHLVTCDLSSGEWSEPARVGECHRYDHHYAPVLWLDHDERMHVLYDCHGGTGTHIVAAEPGATDAWIEGPTIARSISYPHVLPMADGWLLLYYRTLGHMGHWGYQVSDDGGFTWTEPRTLVDMDRDPRIQHDCWAGSYHSAVASRDRRSVHIAFVYLDEQRRPNPLYHRTFKSKRALNRYHLYYLRLDVASGELWTIDGDRLDPPVNREQAEACKALDTGHHLTNMPSIWPDEKDQPVFLMPESGETPWDCTFFCICPKAGGWQKTPMAKTNSTWCGCLLRGDDGGHLTAHVASGKGDGEVLDYGGGDLEEWTSADRGVTWTHARTLDPEPGLLYNNPRVIERPTGDVVEDFILFFG
ncbi:MAG: BNR-4 repeat-containing protein, partial [Armatimonadota bacterium]